MLLENSTDVAALCATLRDAPFVTLDTEFISEKRYRPELCLVQLGAPGHAAAIDPLCEGIDLSPVAALLADPGLLKVLHAGSQDLRIFLHLFGTIPAPLVDTQVMASVCGFGDHAGYATLCRELLDVTIDKTKQATDWSIRPLSDEQVAYALGDVTHLRDLYHALSAKIETLGRANWVTEELAALTDPASYRIAPEHAWKRIRIRRPTPRTLAIISALAAWREQSAEHRNMPRGWIVHDDALVEIAEQLPSTPEQLARVRRLSNATAKGRDGTSILAIVEGVLDQPESEWPVPEPVPFLSEAQHALVSVLQGLLQLRCAEHEVGTQLVASQADLKRLVLGDHTDQPALRGWRAELFGHDALSLLAGDLLLTGGPEGARAISS